MFSQSLKVALSALAQGRPLSLMQGRELSVAAKMP